MSTVRVRIDPERTRALSAAALGRARGAAAPATLVSSRTSVFAEPEVAPISSALGVPPDALRHAGHRWDVIDPLLPGREYEVGSWRTAADDVKEGRTGARLRFVTFARDWHGLVGDLVLRELMTVVHAEGGAPLAPGADALARASTPPPAPVTAVASSWAGAPSGTVLTDVHAGWLTRAGIAHFGRLIGDLTQIHHDVDTARGAGLGDVIAMGMYPAAMLVAVAEDNLDPRSIRSLSIRFRRVVFPGETLRITVRTPAPGAGDADFLLELRAAGELAITGELAVSTAAAP